MAKRKRKIEIYYQQSNHFQEWYHNHKPLIRIIQVIVAILFLVVIFFPRNKFDPNKDICDKWKCEFYIPCPNCMCIMGDCGSWWSEEGRCNPPFRYYKYDSKNICIKWHENPLYQCNITNLNYIKECKTYEQYCDEYDIPIISCIQVCSSINGIYDCRDSCSAVGNLTMKNCSVIKDYCKEEICRKKIVKDLNCDELWSCKSDDCLQWKPWFGADKGECIFLCPKGDYLKEYIDRCGGKNDK